MDHEPGCGSVALCNELGHAPCSLRLPVYGFPGRGRLCSTGMVDYSACNIIVQCTHRDMLLCAVGR